MLAPGCVDHGRRAFLKVSVAAGGGLLVGVYLPSLGRRGSAGAAGAELVPNAWIRIGADDSVTLRVASSEMGQGVCTAIPMLLAEELECDWARVRVENAPADKAYVNPLFAVQATGGSTAVRAFYTPLREAGAAARDLLIAAAAQRWGVKEDSCRAESGYVVHSPSGRRTRYGELVDAAAKLPVPTAALLKDRSEFKLIGKPTRRLDTPFKVNGAALFGQDVRLPGMLTAVVAQMESGVVCNPTAAALYGQITIRNGRVQEGNSHDYPLLRIAEMPPVEVHIVKREEPPGGVGEPGTPPIAPAVANAMFAATHQPVRRLPVLPSAPVRG